MNNGCYIQYYIDNNEAIASDGTNPYDRRLGLRSLIEIAEKKLNSSFFKAKGYNGYSIIKNYKCTEIKLLLKRVMKRIDNERLF